MLVPFPHQSIQQNIQTHPKTSAKAFANIHTDLGAGLAETALKRTLSYLGDRQTIFVRRQELGGLKLGPTGHSEVRTLHVPAPVQVAPD